MVRSMILSHVLLIFVLVYGAMSLVHRNARPHRDKIASKSGRQLSPDEILGTPEVVYGRIFKGIDGGRGGMVSVKG